MDSRPDLTLALDVRCGESVILIAGPESMHDHPKEWIPVLSRSDLDLIGPNCVVVIDRVDVGWRTLTDITVRNPRLLALVPDGVEQEKSMRRLVSSLHPWSEVWTVSTASGKTLVIKDALGDPYDRQNVIDGRLA